MWPRWRASWVAPAAHFGVTFTSCVPRSLSLPRRASDRNFAVSIPDDAPEGIADVQDVPLLEASDRAAELMVAEDVLDPSAEVLTNKMIVHDIVRQFRQRRQQILDRSSTPPRRALRAQVERISLCGADGDCEAQTPCARPGGPSYRS